MAQLIPVDPFDLVIFGGAGDLALRKLLPALYRRDADQQLTDDSRIISVGRSSKAREDYLESVRSFLETALGDEPINQTLWQKFSGRLSYLNLDILDSSTWDALINQLSKDPDKLRIAYLATPPDVYGAAAQGLSELGLVHPNTRIVLEKPVGQDFESARLINDAVGSCFTENQIFRIDHYLGKETVQNLLALRFANSLFEPLWRREVIDHVQITVAEELGVGNRIDFYDDIGTLRDMVQNHLIQLLCMVAMEPPASLDDDAVRDEKIKVLRALKPIRAEQVQANTVRGQYIAGAIDGEAVSGYQDELGGESQCETYVALKVEIDNWRWSGVPFYIRTGKRMPEKHSEIVIQFKPVPHAIFDLGYQTKPNKLTIALQPDEGVELSIMSKDPGPGGFNLRSVSLDLSFEETFETRYPDAYERLLIEVMRGNPALFMRRDEIEAAWRWIDDILSGWTETDQGSEPYVAGSWGPTSAALLMDRDGRAWETSDP
ncbi:MAG: glucose-6-phosphate dehydrogenase [Pseudomonadota bacterium]